jgi:hypothetical protein
VLGFKLSITFEILAEVLKLHSFRQAFPKRQYVSTKLDTPSYVPVLKYTFCGP